MSNDYHDSDPERTRERLIPHRFEKAVLSAWLTRHLQPLAKKIDLAWVWRWFR